MKKWKAKVRVSGRTTEVFIDAKSTADAKALLEAQYGKGCVMGVPIEVK